METGDEIVSGTAAALSIGRELLCSKRMKDAQTLLGTTFAGANQIVQRLVALGVLRELTGHARHRRFRYDSYVRLFEEETRA